MTMSHRDCEHESTPSARAKCRRLQAKGDNPPKAASKRQIDFSGGGGATQQTPRDRDRACMVCGVEPISWRGTDPMTDRLLYVGDKCRYYIKRSLDIQAAE